MMQIPPNRLSDNDFYDLLNTVMDPSYIPPVVDLSQMTPNEIIDLLHRDFGRAKQES